MTTDPQSPRYEVTFELTVSDIAANWSLRQEVTGLKGVLLFLSIGGIAVFFGVFAHWVVAVAFVAFMAVMTFGGFRIIAAVMARLNPHLRGPHRFWIEPEAFGASTTGFGDMRLLWSVIESVSETSSAIVLKYRSSNARAVIPKRAFSTEADFRAFFIAAQAWHRQATCGSASPVASVSDPSL